MNIAFIIPPSPGKKKIIRLIDCSHEAKADYLWQPNDFMIISSLLSPEDDAALIDGTADELGEEDFFSQLDRVKPDMLFFALSGVCWESDYYYFNKTRQFFNSTPFYVIGDIFQEQAYLEYILRECDGVVVNPYMLDIERMSDAGRNEKKELPGVWTKPLNDRRYMDTGMRFTGGYPRHELFLKKNYVFPFARHFRFATVTTMWGCPFACSYCPDSRFQPVVRPWQDIIRELAYLESLRIKELFFADKTFGYPAENITPLLKEMAGRFDFSWSCYFNPKLYRPEFLELMKAAGCHTMIVGIDSADTEMLGKYQRYVDKETIVALLSHADSLNMSVCGDFIIGLEQESEADIMSTIRFAMDLPLDFASFNIAAPLPGSELRRKAVTAGKMVFGKEGYDTLSHRGDLGISAVAYEKLRQLRNKAVRKFYLRPAYIIKRLRKTASAEHFLIQFRQMRAMFRKAGGFRIS